MTTKKSFYRGFLLCLLFLVTLFSCHEKSVETVSDNSASENKRNRITTTLRMDRVPTPRSNSSEAFQPINLRFDKSVAPLEMVEKEIPEGIEIRPAMRGKWVWTSDHDISFYPEQDWTPGEHYSIKVDKEILVADVDFGRQNVEFNVRGLDILNRSGQFYIDPQDPKIKRVLMEVSFNYPVKLEDMLSSSSLVNNSREVDRSFPASFHMDVSLSEDQKKAFFVSEPLAIPADSVELLFRLEKGYTSTLGGPSVRNNVDVKVQVPGSSTYVKIQSSDIAVVRNEDYEFDQVLVFSTKGESSLEDIRDYIDVRLLPRDRPEEPGIESRSRYNWNVGDITELVMGQTSSVDFGMLPTERDYSPVQSMQIHTEPGRYVYFKIRAGAPFYGGYELAKDFEQVIRVPEYPKMMEIMGEGAILSMSGSRKITLITQGVNRANVRLYRVRQNQMNHLLTQTQGDINNLRFYSSRFNEENISELFSERIDMGNVSVEETVFSSIDLTEYLHRSGQDRNGFFFMKIEDSNRRANSISRFIMVTDLGILVKKNVDRTYDLFVQSVHTTSPVGRARVEVLGKNGLPIFSGYTADDGHLRIPSLSNYSNEKSPVVILVRKGNDVSFLPYDDNHRKLSYSNFDTGGEWGRDDPLSLKGYLFSDRGVYRPGDSFHIGMIVRSGNWQGRLKGTPVRAKITNPQGELIYETDLFLDEYGLQELEYQTQEYNPTGNYQISLYLIGERDRLTSLGSTTIELKEFLPERLRIESQFLGEFHKGWMNPEDLELQVSLRNLFGAPAVGNDIHSNLQVSPAYLYFPQYREYRFSDPYKTGKNYFQDMDKTQTDEEGLVKYDIDLSQFDRGSYRITSESIGLEKGSGRNVSTSTSIVVSPNEYLVGWKTESSLSYIYKGAEIFVDYVAVNSDLETIPVDDLELYTIEKKYISVLTKQNNGTYKYQSVLNEEILGQERYSIQGEGSKLPLDTSQAGDYAIELRDREDHVLARFSYSVVGQGNLTRRLDTNSELQIKLNQSSYAPGETIEVFVKAPYEGSGLITIERDSVKSYKWFSTSNNTALERITVPRDMEGNGYVNVTFIRAAESDKVYMSPLSYGAAPFNIDRDARINDILLTVPDRVRPGEVIDINYETEIPGKVLIYGVDQGILQIADYRTPNPLAEFMKKRALEVQTFQLLDLILPDFEFSGRDNPFGGGAGYDELLEANLNPFKRKRDDPVVFWSGLMDNPSGRGTYQYTVPDYYNGAIKFFAIAVNEDAIGVTTESTYVRNDLIIMPNVPLFATPGDTFVVTATVNNQIDGADVQDVTLSLKASDQLEIIGESSQTHSIKKGLDSLYSFQVKANSLLGSGDLEFLASGGDKEAIRSVSLSVRPSMPYRVRMYTDIVKQEKEQLVGLYEDQYMEFQEKSMSLSYLPIGLSEGLRTYLDKYPYGCTEQITSRTFPWILLAGVPDFGVEAGEAQEKLNNTMNVIMSRQRGDGSIGYWNSRSYVNINYAVYALHMTLEARERGFYMPETVLNRGKSFLWDVAKKRTDGSPSYEDRAYAIYLLTRMEEITTNELIQLDTELRKQDNWQDSPALPFMAGAYKLLHMEDEAQSIMSAIRWSSVASVIRTYHYYRSNCQYMYIVARHFPEKISNLNRFIPNMVSMLKEGRYNTINSAWTILAFTEILKNEHEALGQNFTVTQYDSNDRGKELEFLGSLYFQGEISPGSQSVNISNENTLDLYYQVVESGFDISMPEKAIAEGLEVFSEIQMDGNVKKELMVGDQAEMVVSYRTVGDVTSLYNVALVVLMPAGCEVAPEFRPGNRSGSVEFVDVREDRVVLYVNADKDREEFTIPIQAVNAGDFIYPPLFGQAMYELEYYSYSEPGRISIEEAE